MIQARIRKHYSGRADTRNFTLDIRIETAAGVTVLFGPSGAGKTLTLDAIAGFVTPDEGRILVGDDLLFDSAARVSLPPQRRRCGYRGFLPFLPRWFLGGGCKHTSRARRP